MLFLEYGPIHNKQATLHFSLILAKMCFHYRGLNPTGLVQQVTLAFGFKQVTGQWRHLVDIIVFSVFLLLFFKVQYPTVKSMQGALEKGHIQKQDIAVLSVCCRPAQT